KRLTVLKGGSDLLRAKWLIITLRPTPYHPSSGSIPANTAHSATTLRPLMMSDVDRQRSMNTAY
ncbi:hypothetical protein, partial [Burkholderia anthina]|uniref:hypothetical protein n=1 Tax=Burkholderia anthina TaxID=179879 RepID=UPI001C892599